jgi:hypothetical protein
MNQVMKNSNDAMSFVINSLRNILKNPIKRGYGSDVRKFDFSSCDIIPSNYQTHTEQEHSGNALILDALWDLTRRGILRQSTRNDNNISFSSFAYFRYYTFTEVGKEWLLSGDETRFVFGSSSSYASLLQGFKDKLGADYLVWGIEAANCYQFSLYIATCAMSGASGESILRHLHKVKFGEERTCKVFKENNGKNKAIDDLAQGKNDIKNRLQSFNDKLSIWRNDSVHGDVPYMEDFHAYVSLSSLLSMAKYAFDNFERITKNDQI